MSVQPWDSLCQVFGLVEIGGGQARAWGEGIAACAFVDTGRARLTLLQPLDIVPPTPGFLILHSINAQGAGQVANVTLQDASTIQIEMIDAAGDPWGGLTSLSLIVLVRQMELVA